MADVCLTTSRSLALFALAAWSCAGVQAQGVAAPDAGSVLRDLQRAQPQPAPALPPKAPEPAPRAADDTAFQVSRFELQGVTLLPLAELQALLKPWRGRDVVFADLQDATVAIAERYRERGWYATAQLPPQDVVDGVVRVQVNEALFGGLRIDEAASLPLSRERINRTFGAQQQAGEPLNIMRMNRAIGLLNDLPGVRAKAALDAGSQAQATDVVLGFEPRPAWSGSATLDNQGSRATGAERLNSSFSLDNPSGWGDQAQANFMTSEGVKFMRLAYSVPVGYAGLRLSAHASAMNYRLVTGANALGSAYTRGLSLNQPWLRGTTANANLGASHTQADYFNEANGQSISRKSGRITALTVSGDAYDTWQGGASNIWSVSTTFGDMTELGTGTKRQAKLNANVARLQRVSDTHNLWLSWTGQRAFKPLDSSEKFTLGGAQGVRAYAASQGIGDHGWLLTLESRHNLRSDLQLSAFYDTGGVTVSQDTAAVKPETVNNYSLSGAGLGLRYTHSSNTSANLVWSRRLGSHPLADAKTGKDTDGTRVLDRLWLTVSSFF